MIRYSFEHTRDTRPTDPLLTGGGHVDAGIGQGLYHRLIGEPAGVSSQAPCAAFASSAISCLRTRRARTGPPSVASITGRNASRSVVPMLR